MYAPYQWYAISSSIGLPYDSNILFGGVNNQPSHYIEFFYRHTDTPVALKTDLAKCKSSGRNCFSQKDILQDPTDPMLDFESINMSEIKEGYRSMRAIGIRDGKGAAEALFFHSIPVPQPKGDEVLVKIKAFGLNRMDVIQRNGEYNLPPGVPETLRVEFSGVVSETGMSRDWIIGNEVFGLAYGGTYAEYIAVSGRMLVRKPVELSWAQAAAVPETWMTAIQAMYLVGGFAPGKSILWHAGASSVAISGTQIAKVDSVSQIFPTVGSDSKVQFCVDELGVTDAFNYKTQNWPEGILKATQGRGVDVIVDLVGASRFQGNIDAAAAKDGRIAHLGQVSGTILPDGVDIGAMLWKRVRFEGSTLRSRDIDYQSELKDSFIEHALPKLRNGTLNVVIERQFSWTEIIEAHKLMETNTAQGKLVYRID